MLSNLYSYATKTFICVLIVASSCLSLTANEYDTDTMFDVEELRVEKLAEVEQLDPAVSVAVTELQKLLGSVKRYSKTSIMAAVQQSAHTLWSESVSKMSADPLSDDRWLYWQRLILRRTLKQSVVFQSLTSEQQQAILWELELVSRGRDDVNFDDNADIKILVTGFDPFFLDRNIRQSNPSGAAALTFDDQLIEHKGIKASIQGFVVPVRYADFDRGMIETLLSPYYTEVDMIATISMGRSDFDLERYPGLRRSAAAPDNLNVYTGANKNKPLIPDLYGNPWAGPEFVEFSLPVMAMLKAKGAYAVNDNHKVTTLNGDFEPKSLEELATETAVSGAGGGYLSNEISYRSIRLRNHLNPQLPVGHIHTPRIEAFAPDDTRAIIAQIKSMLKISLSELKK